ncbi:MAG: 50S ribosomal protein L10 [Chloroflexi bacterium]|nr:50S ribosomal protein L10 [Chloroflexota bacterium]
MPTEKKERIVDDVTQSFEKSKVIILAHYQGMTTAEMTGLRRKLQAVQSELQVTKNTLFRLAAERLGKRDMVESASGPTAVVFGYGDVVAPARVLAGYVGEGKGSLTLRGGILGARVLTPADVATLATLPSREVLLAKVFGQMKSPVAGLLGCLTAPMRGMVGVLQARINQLEEK